METITEFFSIEFLILLACGGLGVFFAFFIFQKIADSGDVEDKLARSFSSHQKEMMMADAPEEGEFIKDFIDDRIVDHFPMLGKKMVHAGFKISAMQYVLQSILISVALACIAFFMAKIKIGDLVMAMIAGICALGVGIFICFMFLEFKIAGHVKEFDEQFGVGLDVMASAMQAGSTFMGAIKFVAESNDPPLGEQMGILSTEMGLGVETTEALDRFRDRMPSKNLFLFLIGVKVALTTGAALAPVFNTLSVIIMERFRLQGLINTAISENFYGIIILGSFPWVILPWLISAWPEAYEAFFASLLGKIVSTVAFIWYCYGLYLMYSTIKGIDT